MTLERAVSETIDGRYVVRFVNGVGVPIEYRCATASQARALVAVLGGGSSSVAAGPRPLPRVSQYRVELTPTSRAEIQALGEDEWEVVRKQLALIAVDAAEAAPPSRAMLVAAGVQPPVLRQRVGRHAVVYEADSEERTLTVLHVLEVG